MLPPGRCAGLSWRGVSGAEQQQRETGGRRGWWLVGLLAVSGAAVGALAGSRLDPDVSELAPSLAVAGFGLGGLVGLCLLAPVGLWRAWRRRQARRRAATPERRDMPDGPALWHTAEREREAAPTGTADAPVRSVIEAPAADTEPRRPGEPAPGPGVGQADALAPQAPEPEREEGENPAGRTQGLEPEEPPPPAGEEPGWSPDPARDDLRRYWDGNAWTGHVWGGRTRERKRKARSRR